MTENGYSSSGKFRCRKCGASVGANSKFCTSCGASLPEGRPPNSQGLKSEAQAASGNETGKRRAPIVLLVVIAAIVAIVGYLAFTALQNGYLQVDRLATSIDDAVSDNGQVHVGDEIVSVEDAARLDEERKRKADAESSKAREFVLTTDSDHANAAQLLREGTLPATATASSVLATSEFGDYYAENALDKDLATAWVEGAAGAGEGESLTLNLASRDRVGGIGLFSGYMKSDDIFSKNARPHSITILADGEAVCSVELSDGNGRWQRISFDSPVEASSITIQINSVYPGTKYADCAISEVAVYGASAAESAAYESF